MGAWRNLDIYAATVIWDGQERMVETDAAETEPLVGMSLIYGYDLWIRALDGAPVTIEKAPRSTLCHPNSRRCLRRSHQVDDVAGWQYHFYRV